MALVLVKVQSYICIFLECSGYLSDNRVLRMLRELQDIGLSEKEAKVYSAALELGPATADQLAKHGKIVRSTTYVQLESLMEKGLMSTYEQGKKTFFAPESPELLKRFLAKQKENIGAKENDLASFLPDLLRQFESAGERPVVRFFPGKEGIKLAREELLTTKDKKIDAIFSYEHLLKIYTKDELNLYSTKRKELGIHSRAIYINKEFFSVADLDQLTERKFMSPEKMQLNIHIHVCDTRTTIFPLEGTLFALVIDSRQIAVGIKSIFNFLWASSESQQ